MKGGRASGWVAVAALVLGLGWWLLRSEREASAGKAGVAAPVGAGAGAYGTGRAEPEHSADRLVKDTPDGILHYVDALNTAGQSPRDDVRLLASLLDLYRSVLHTTNPVGDNIDITAVLTGNNKAGYAFIRPDHPAINAKGELCDRWGTPYFFHQISGTMMQIRSAGPDRKHWTADDLVAP